MIDPAARERLAVLGQWFTPAPVADLALALALPPGARARRGLRVLDPCCGDGVFLARAAAAGVPAAGLHGVDIDAACAAAAAARVPGAAVRHADLFSLAPPDGGAGGFDCVVGNPPYVRQERLTSAHKRRLHDRLAADWADDAVLGLVGRGDLAAACVAHALALLRPGGRLGLVVSSALVDADYAAPLWRLLARHGRLLALVEPTTERWFADAAVNAMILVAERGGGEPSSSASPRAAAGPPLVARLRVPTAEAARRVGRLSDLGAVADVRRADAASPRGLAAALRAPAAWFELLDAAGDALVPLGSLAEVRRGLTTGANGVFYLSRARAAALRLEPDALRPLVRSPRERGAATIAIDPAATSHVALVLPAEAGALRRWPAVRRYLARPEAAAAAARPTLRARPAWWALPARPARLFLAKAYGERFVQRLAPAPVVADQRVYAVAPACGVDVELLAAVLNSSFCALALESLGRASLGEGALELSVADAALVPVLDARRLDRAGAAALRAALATCAARPIGTVATERPRADRAALDLAAARIAPSIAELRAAVADALVATVAQRTTRASRFLP